MIKDSPTSVKCLQCGDTFNTPFASRPKKFCRLCMKLRTNDSGRAKAAIAVKKAIQRGELAPPSTLDCVDCGAPAKHYEHRDYSAPLKVEPVCIRCNALRGPGNWVRYTPLRQLIRQAA